jgi:hypothetical protein
MVACASEGCSVSDDDTQLQTEAQELEAMLARLHETVPQEHRVTVDAVLRRIVSLYGAGLDHALRLARRSAADPASFDVLVMRDELLASLLLVHGLHPLPTEDRVRKALAIVEVELGHTLAIESIADGVLELRADAPLGGGAVARDVNERVIRRVIETHAPELVELRIVGLPPRPQGLVQLRVQR